MHRCSVLLVGLRQLQPASFSGRTQPPVSSHRLSFPDRLLSNSDKLTTSDNQSEFPIWTSNLPPPSSSTARTFCQSDFRDTAVFPIESVRRPGEVYSYSPRSDLPSSLSLWSPSPTILPFWSRVRLSVLSYLATSRPVPSRNHGPSNRPIILPVLSRRNPSFIVFNLVGVNPTQQGQKSSSFSRSQKSRSPKCVPRNHRR